MPDAPTPPQATPSADLAGRPGSAVAATAVRKAVIPVAGLGTRFLPATKAVPKEMLPVVDRPAIEYVVAEAAAAGLTDILMVSGRNKTAIEDHFDRAPEVESALEAKGDQARLAAVRSSTDLTEMHFVRQGQPRGLGHAVLCGAPHVGREPFAVLLGDDLIDERDPLLPKMIEVQQRYRGSVIALMEVPADTISLYGCAAVEPTDEPDVYRVTGTVEKPDPADAPSDLAMIGRYVLAPTVFDVLSETPPGRGGEIQLTDAINVLCSKPAEDGGGVFGVVHRGRRYDTGDKADYLKAIVQLAADREDLGPALLDFLVGFVAERRGATGGQGPDGPGAEGGPAGTPQVSSPAQAAGAPGAAAQTATETATDAVEDPAGPSLPWPAGA